MDPTASGWGIRQFKTYLLHRLEMVPWSGVCTKYSMSPFAEEMFKKLDRMLSEYEVVINRWPQYMLILENAAANVERAIIKAVETQYYEISKEAVNCSLFHS